MALTDGWGVDVAVEAVGIPQTFQMVTEIVRPGGHVANVGVHGTSVDLELQKLWIHNISIFILGKRTRNAPINAATAPEAPTQGMMLAGLVQA